MAAQFENDSDSPDLKSIDLAQRNLCKRRSLNYDMRNGDEASLGGLFAENGYEVEVTRRVVWPIWVASQEIPVDDIGGSTIDASGICWYEAMCLS